MTPHEREPSTARSRRANFMREFSGDHPHSAAATGRLPPTHPLIQRAEQFLASTFSTLADAIGFKLNPADSAAMRARALPDLQGMPKEDLAAISPTSAALRSIALAAFATTATLDAAQRQQIQQIKDSFIGTGELPKAFGDESRFAGLSREALRNMERMRLAEQTTSASMSEGVARNMMEARSLADRLGIGWAKESPELLKLGPAAITALHEAGVEKSRFMRMTGKTVGFSAETAVEVAKFAKRHNLTPAETNSLYDNINKGVESLVKDKTPEEKLKIQRELDEATKKYMKGTDSPEAREELNKAWQKHADTPEKKRDAEQATGAITAATTQRDAAVKTEATTAAKAAALVTNNAALEAELNGPAPAATPASAASPATPTTTTPQTKAPTKAPAPPAPTK